MLAKLLHEQLQDDTHSRRRHITTLPMSRGVDEMSLARSSVSSPACNWKSALVICSWWSLLGRAVDGASAELRGHHGMILLAISHNRGAFQRGCAEMGGHREVILGPWRGVDGPPHRLCATTSMCDTSRCRADSDGLSTGSNCGTARRSSRWAFDFLWAHSNEWPL